MTASVGAGLYIAKTEQSPIKQNDTINQLIQGRSNAVLLATLANGSGQTSTLVTAPACGARSCVFLFPATAHAAAVTTTTYVKTADVAAQQFYITHASTASTDLTYFCVALG